MPSETFTTFADQVLVVLRLNIDRLVPGEQVGLQVDLGEIMSLLLAYITRLGRDEGNHRIRVKLCQLVDSVLARSEFIALSNEANLRNSLLETMVEWAIEAQRVSWCRVRG
jgi:neurofibromin 1